MAKAWGLVAARRDTRPPKTLRRIRRGTAVRGCELDAYGGRARNTVPCEARSLQPLGLMKKLAAFTWHARQCEYINLNIRDAIDSWQRPDIVQST